MPLSRQISAPAPRRRRSRRCASGTATRRGAAVRPASDRVAAMSAARRERARQFARLGGAAEHQQAHRRAPAGGAHERAWLTIIGLGEDGLAASLLPQAQRLRQAALVVGGARHLALVGDDSTRETLARGPRRSKRPSPHPRAARRAGLRAGVRRSVLLRRRLAAGAARRRRASSIALPAPSAFSLAGVAPRLGVAGLRARLAARPRAGAHHPASAAAARACSRCRGTATTPQQLAALLTARAASALRA